MKALAVTASLAHNGLSGAGLHPRRWSLPSVLGQDHSRRSCLFPDAAGFLIVLPLATDDKPLPPAQAAGNMTLPEGFHATLFAVEPDVVQPIAMTTDDRGRLWVVECLSYPTWAK